MSIQFDVIFENFPKFLEGLWNTIWLCTAGMALSLLLGILLLIPLISPSRIARSSVQSFVDAARAVPFLMLAYVIYYGLPSLGLTLDSWTTAVVTIVVYNTAYIAEILRSAWANLPFGQIEAGRAYGFTGWQLLRRIILPQVMLSSVPVLGNQFIQIIKDSAFLSIITIQELTFVARSIQSTYYVPFESFFVAALLYWLLCLTVELGVSRVETLRSIYAR
ncbi:amino acid ABC transporter membrane protein 2, PAAT family [Gloeocapsa sp. PCC 7428]|uniref:amino acid ABC transporter permease n=1 Tax=Gloeocapsa sp. PCC 7428 TaxID=1173026 RepID=UPI0002A60187|nr:amino acid ABC transporter permease [Gloeocapsa sp. PCC 7428]AFZ32541.1 amino acid ABC transporter membrane protein 2, PAAT family [Gloeocapsa sp. PCC 7428]